MESKLDWNVGEDEENIRDGAIDLQSKLHQRKYKPNFETPAKTRKWLNNGRAVWRKKTIDKVELFLDRPIKGTVLEIGAGTGWCSGRLSKKNTVDEVFSLEYDPYCVDTLMPLVHDNMDADTDKIKHVLGSFNNLPKQDFFDVIVSMGAIHHSENLSATLAESYKALKPGGTFFASEPMESDRMSQGVQLAKEERIDPDSEEKYGEETKHKENSDQYVRLCQYLAESYRAGFDVFPYVFDLEVGRRAGDQIFTQRKCWDKFTARIHQPYFNKKAYDNLLLILRKPENQDPSFKELQAYEDSVPQNPAPPILPTLTQKLRRLALEIWKKL